MRKGWLVDAGGLGLCAVVVLMFLAGTSVTYAGEDNTQGNCIVRSSTGSCGTINNRPCNTQNFLSGTCVDSGRTSPPCFCQGANTPRPQGQCTVNLFPVQTITLEPGAMLTGNARVNCPVTALNSPKELHLAILTPTGGIVFFASNGNQFTGGFQGTPSPMTFSPIPGGNSWTLPSIPVPAGVPLGTYRMFGLVGDQGFDINDPISWLSPLGSAAIVLAMPGGPIL